MFDAQWARYLLAVCIVSTWKGFQMCRLMYLPPNCGVQRKALVKLFTWLVKRGGGDGNGVGAVWVRPDRQTLIYKGLKIPPAKIANMAHSWNVQGAHVVLHTRNATSGGVTDPNCQPFKARNTLLAQNGIWGQGTGIAAIFEKDDSDTGAFARMWRQKGLRWIKRNGLYPPSGVWLLIGRRRQVVLVPDSWFTIEYDRTTGIWASEFPWNQKCWDCYEVAPGEYTLRSEGGDPQRKSWAEIQYGSRSAYTGYAGFSGASDGNTVDGNKRADEFTGGTELSIYETAAEELTRLHRSQGGIVDGTAHLRAAEEKRQGIDDDMDAPTQIGVTDV